ncbi:MAG: PAS domain S-box protein [Planctomycetia bacterium]|nr:PAS domain S-box protein [Planctomycetia bacterium]
MACPSDDLSPSSARARDEDRLQLFFDAALEGIVVHVKGAILEANPPAATLFGVTVADMLGRDLLEFAAPESHDLIHRHIDACFEGTYAVTGLRRDGSTFPQELHTRHTEYRGQKVCIVVLRDISERKRNEAALRGRERQVRAAFDGALDAMAMLDDLGQFLDVNPAACSLFGMTREELLHRRLFEFAESKADFDLLWNRLREQQHQRGEFRLLRPDGGRRWAEYSATADLLPGRHLAILRDISERKRLEEQLRQAQKMEAIGRLAGGVAHDFNNLLTAIISYSELLLEAVPVADSGHRYAEEIIHAAERAAGLTRQLLAYSRQQVLSPQVLNLNNVVSGLERLLCRLIGEDVVLVTQLDPALRKVKADPGQIEQVIMNLAVNGRDAMPRGGTLTIATANVELDEGYAWAHMDVQPGAYVRLSVGDTGSGMSEDVRAHLFEPFFTTKEVGKGTGLGLSTVYGIIKQSEGHVEVASTLGQGSTFHVYLPQVMEASRREQRPAVEPRSGRGWETILLVEDDDVVRALARTVLQQQGYTIIEAAHGVAALQLSSRFPGPLHMLLTDVVMPHMNGPQLYAQLARLRPGLKVLYMSGYTGGAIAHLGELEAEAAFLQKPFPAEVLSRKVREVLDH